MPRRSVQEWLRWQESLYPRWIELDLARVRTVSGRLGGVRPVGPVFTVTGTNGKGSTVALLEAFLLAAGRRPGVYTSPHLVAYNERIRVAGVAVADADLVAAFERVETARGDVLLTFFEYGTLAALVAFEAAACDCWVLEVGMGGRLDAVNAIDADFALITTVDLDHQEFLGNTVAAIAAEKAGILRAGRPAFYGDQPVPDAILDASARLGAPLSSPGAGFDFSAAEEGYWSWRGAHRILDRLERPPWATTAQLRNISLVLAVIEQYDSRLLADVAPVNALIARARPPGRFQVVHREHEWVLDVAHNPQAVATLRAQLDTLPAADATVVIGLLGDKSLDAFVVSLGPLVTRWISCGVDDPRARDGASIAARLRELGASAVTAADSVDDALARARRLAPAGGRIIVCGSFRVVGPALRWLGIY